jgi:hypothetical protein
MPLVQGVVDRLPGQAVFDYLVTVRLQPALEFIQHRQVQDLALLALLLRFQRKRAAFTPCQLLRVSSCEATSLRSHCSYASVDLSVHPSDRHRDQAR